MKAERMCVEMNGWKRALAAVVFSAGTFASGCLGWAAAGYIPQEEETASAPIGENAVLVGGMPVGIYMETDGVLVLDTQSIESETGEPKRRFDGGAAASGRYTGDSDFAPGNTDTGRPA